MCNRYRLAHTTIDDFARDFSQLKIPLVFPAGAPNLQPRQDIRPTNTVPVFRPVDAAGPAAGVEWATMRWWLVPFFHKGKALKDWKPMCTNARAETVATTATFKGAFSRRRCLVPADGFYEWTGEKGAKEKWLFTRTDGQWFSFAGIWDRCETAEGPIESLAILTTPPGPDAAPYHNRQPVILERDQWSRWLDLEADVAPLLQPGPAGVLKVEKAPPEVKDAA